MTDDHGSDVTGDRVHDRVYAVGSEVSVFIPSAKMFLYLRSLWEFGAVDRPQRPHAGLYGRFDCFRENDYD